MSYPNMSYCQFENTARALEQIVDTLFNNGEDPKDVVNKLSRDEAQGYKDCIDRMTNILEELGYEITPPEDV